jgi:hypothetical protein
MWRTYSNPDPHGANECRNKGMMKLVGVDKTIIVVESNYIS